METPDGWRQTQVLITPSTACGDSPFATHRPHGPLFEAEKVGKEKGAPTEKSVVDPQSLRRETAVQQGQYHQRTHHHAKMQQQGLPMAVADLPSGGYSAHRFSSILSKGVLAAPVISKYRTAGLEHRNSSLIGPKNVRRPDFGGIVIRGRGVFEQGLLEKEFTNGLWVGT